MILKSSFAKELGMSNFSETEVPNKREQQLALESSQVFANLLETQKDLELKFESTSVTLPVSAVKLLQYILLEIADGNAVTVAKHNSELSTQQAADLLNVSRPYLVSLLEQDKMPYHKVGSHRRILFSDVISYKEQSYNKSHAALEELTKQAQDLNMGY